MYKFVIAYILTLVLPNKLIFAESNKFVSPLQKSTETSVNVKDDNVNKINLDDENLILTQPPIVNPRSTLENNYPYTQSFSPRIGTLVDVQNISEELGNSFHMLYGITYMFPRNRSPQLEVGADIIKNHNGQFHASKRWIINERTSFRPFYKLGVTVAAIGREGLATFTNIDNYLARASVGFEDYYKRPMSFRWELELSLGLEDVFLYLNFGYSWGF
ncbi:MAG: hypothetical protein KDD40_01990 [Bdellovibrionales bacterium]|nr:hypothetical protein [Bdellovibrionales bacterium]